MLNIDELRDLLYCTVKVCGLTHPVTIHVSQVLDVAIVAEQGRLA